jgi:4-hydroxy-2-oxoheptanedioate aldolase
MLGIFSKTIDSNFIEAAGYCQLDFIILDQEHGPASLDILQNHVRAAKITKMKSIIRVANNNANLIGAALDTGADGVQVPNISNYEQAIEAVKAAKFYPKGMRGVCRFVNAANYGLKDKNEYFETENKKILILQVEGSEGIKELDKILSIQDFDILFIGPYDLSQSAGYPGDIEHPVVIKLIEEIANKVKKSKKILGCFADKVETALKLKNSGFDFIAYSVDVSLFSEKIVEIKNRLK